MTCDHYYIRNDGRCSDCGVGLSGDALTIATLTEALRTIGFEERLDKRSMQLVARVALLTAFGGVARERV